MDIYCPACGKKGRIDDAKIPDSGVFARCPGCKKRLWINKVDGVSLAEEPSSRIHSHDEKPPAAAPASDPPPAKVPSAETDPQHQAGTPSDMVDQQSEAATPSAAPTPTPDPAPEPPAQQPQQTLPIPPVPGPAAGFDVSPLPAAAPQPGTVSPQGETAQGTGCSVCGGVFPDSDIVRFGDKKVCAGCKPQFVQMMKTGVAMEGSFRYGGFWIRFVAKVIDWIIMAIAQGIIITPLMMFVFKSALTTPDPANLSSFFTANILINIVSVAMGAAYTTLFIGKYQATPGKMAFGLKVVAPDGGRITYMRALGRHFAEIVSGLILGIGYIMAGFDSQKRSLHDRICATRVIRA